MGGSPTTGKSSLGGEIGRARAALADEAESLLARIQERYFGGQTVLAAKTMVGSAIQSMNSGEVASSARLDVPPAQESQELRASGLGCSTVSDDGRLTGSLLPAASQTSTAATSISAAIGPSESEVRDARAKQLADRFDQTALLEASRRAERLPQFIEVLEAFRGFVSVYGKQGGNESDQARKTVRINFERASIWTVREISLRYYELLIDLQVAGTPSSLNAIQQQQLVSALVEALNRDVFRGKEKVICEPGVVKLLDEGKHEVVGERGSGASPAYAPLSFGVGRDLARLEERILVNAIREGLGS